MMLRPITSLCCGMLTLGTLAQITSDKPVVLSGEFPETRQVTGLPPSHEPDAVLSVAVERNGAYRIAAPSPGNQWSVTLDALTTAPPAGTHLVIIAPGPTAGDVGLLVNGHGPYPLLSGVSERVDGILLPEGTALSVVMDGTSFHIMNGNVRPRRPCIEGTVAVSESYCIEPREHQTADLFTAITTCGDQGMRLCDWGEFLTACQRAVGLGLLGGTDNWEWTGDASNENNCARIVGAGSCLSAGNALVTGSINRTYRCCYSR